MDIPDPQEATVQQYELEKLAIDHRLEGSEGKFGPLVNPLMVIAVYLYKKVKSNGLLREPMRLLHNEMLYDLNSGFNDREQPFRLMAILTLMINLIPDDTLKLAASVCAAREFRRLAHPCR